jgi:hypothetical protein
MAAFNKLTFVKLLQFVIYNDELLMLCALIVLTIDSFASSDILELEIFMLVIFPNELSILKDPA